MALKVFAGHRASLAPYARAVPGIHAYVVAPGARILFLPLDEPLHDALHRVHGTGEWPDGASFGLSSGDMAFAAAASRAAPLAYIEVSVEGLEAYQAAALWIGGVIHIPPAIMSAATATQRPPALWPVNAVLRGLGVRTDGATDEFTATGLAGFADNADVHARGVPVSYFSV